jgi:hypothetical protein
MNDTSIENSWLNRHGLANHGIKYHIACQYPARNAMVSAQLGEILGRDLTLGISSIKGRVIS